MASIRNILIGSVAAATAAGVVVSCGGGGGDDAGGTPSYSVGGNLTGASGNVVLQLNGGSPITMGNGAFMFATMVAMGSTYNVTVAAPNQKCTVTNGAGTMGATNIGNVAVNCAAQTTQTVIMSALLSGAQENPPVASSATGVGGVIVDPTDVDGGGNIRITGGMTFSGLTPTLGGHHIHQAPAGQPTNNGPVIIGLTLASDGVTAFVPTGTRLTPAQYTALLAGELYFNVHTVANSGGEIRGQINMQGGVHAGFANLTAGQEVPAGASTATGVGTLVVDKATRNILISYFTHNVTNPTMAHIHSSPTGAAGNGPVIINFNLGTGFAAPAAGTQMSAQNITDLLANYLYFNIHSDNLLCGPMGNASCAGGEIRGNIAPLP